MEKDSRLFTGGQIYDNKIFNEIDELERFNVKKIPLETKLSKKITLLSPLVYLCKGFNLKKTDILIFNSSLFLRCFPLLLLFKIKGYNNIYTIHHHFIYQTLKGFKKCIYKIFEWSFLSLSDKLIIPSPYILDILKSHIKTPKLLLWKIPFSKETSVRPEPKKGNLTFMGTIEKRKGLHLLMKSLKILSGNNVSYSLTIAGEVVDKKYYDQLKRFISKNNLNVLFTGYLNDDDKEQLLSKTDLFVFPSSLEGFGMVLIEAQKFAIPIVCFNNSAMPYSVKHGLNGFCVKDGDEKEFAQYITTLINDRKMRESFSMEALKNLENQNTPENFKSQIRNYFLQQL